MISTIFLFIANPKEAIHHTSTPKKILLEFIWLLLTLLILKVLAVLLLEGIKTFGLVENYKRTIEVEVSTKRNSLLFAALLYPILEEIAFRLYLKRTAINLLLSSFFLGYLISSAFVFQTSHFDFSVYLWQRLLFATGWALIFGVVLKSQIEKVDFKWLFYFSALLFGLVHIYNFNYQSIQVLLFAPLICLPQLIGGLFFGYTRIKYGLLGSIALHGLMNGLLTLI